MHTDYISVETLNMTWNSVTISKKMPNHRFTFESALLSALCGGDFMRANIEVLELNNRLMRISLIRPETHLTLYMNIVFSTIVDIQRFVREIRTHPTRVYFLSVSSCSLVYIHKHRIDGNNLLDFRYSNST